MGAKMSFEGELYYGAAGSTAGTKITNIAGDVTYDITPEKGDTTERGTGSATPINTSRVTALTISISWSMLQKAIADDATLESLKVAAAAGTPVAIRTLDYAAAKGFDGDCVLTMKKGEPFKGAQTVEFTAEPTAESGRTPSLYT